MIVLPGIKHSGARPHFGDRAEMIPPGVNFSGARLNEADLSGANLWYATGLTQAQLNGARGDAKQNCLKDSPGQTHGVIKLPPALPNPAPFALCLSGLGRFAWSSLTGRCMAAR